MGDESWKFEPLRPEDAAGLFAGVTFRWWVAGGWALDLFLGSETRPHADLDIAVLRSEKDMIRSQLPGWELQWVGPAETLFQWHWSARGETVHQLRARRSQNETEPFTCDFLLNDERGGLWVYRRDRRVTRPLEEIGGRRNGIPFLRPGIVLLYKSKEDLPKTAADFVAVEPELEPDERVWLAEALELTKPNHPWLAMLRP